MSERPQKRAPGTVRHYSTGHKIIAWVSQSLFDHVTYTVRHGLIKGMRRRGGLGWVPERFGASRETPETRFWRQLQLDDLVVYDVGAFHGLLTLFFAKRARQVVGYEPNSRNHERLVENLRLNQVTNVLVRKVGLGAAPQRALMNTPTLMRGGASIEAAIVEGMRRRGMAIDTEWIQLTTLDQDIRDHSLPRPDLIKIDVEGCERSVLEGARDTLSQHGPALFIEMHGETLDLKRENVAQVMGFLHDLGYTRALHIESGMEVTAADSVAAAEGHVYLAGNPTLS